MLARSPGGASGRDGLGNAARPGAGLASRRLCHRWSPLPVLPPSSCLAGGSSCVPLAALASPQPPEASPSSPTRSGRQSPAGERACERGSIQPQKLRTGETGDPRPARSNRGPSSGSEERRPCLPRLAALGCLDYSVRWQGFPATVSRGGAGCLGALD